MYVRGVDYVCINMYLDLNEHKRLREWLIENSNPVLSIYLYKFVETYLETTTGIGCQCM